MSANCNITNVVDNQTDFRLTPASSDLTSGLWITSPQPIDKRSSITAFQARGVSGTATGAVGYAVYNVYSGSNLMGTFQFNFSDPYSGSNSCTSSTTVQKIQGSNNCPSSGSTFTVTWTLKAQ